MQRKGTSPYGGVVEPLEKAIESDKGFAAGEAFFVRPGDPVPGQLRSLGEGVDRADVSNLLTVLATLGSFRQRTGKNPSKLAREAL
jgi:hypothetical protein